MTEFTVSCSVWKGDKRKIDFLKNTGAVGRERQAIRAWDSGQDSGYQTVWPGMTPPCLASKSPCHHQAKFSNKLHGETKTRPQGVGWAKA